jgi:hypothetical protein
VGPRTHIVWQQQRLRLTPPPRGVLCLSTRANNNRLFHLGVFINEKGLKFTNNLLNSFKNRLEKDILFGHDLVGLNNYECVIIQKKKIKGKIFNF